LSIRAIRGATIIDENTKIDIVQKTKEMLSKMICENDISVSDIISIVFSVTDDITACPPAVAARSLGITEAGLMCVSEMKSDSEAGIPMCVRALMTVQLGISQQSITHIYVNGAEILRPDLAGAASRFKSIAIDGPCGSGKSTVAKKVADKLGFLHVDTGAMYRAVAYHCITAGVSLTDEIKIIKIAESINITLAKDLVDKSQRIFLNDQDVTELIRTQQVAEGSSFVAGIKEVREKLVDIQRKIAKRSNVVMDGRDIGSFVLKDASLKVYLDADVTIRAKRRLDELFEKGQGADFETVKEEIKMRDLRDMSREFSPLIKADDAKIIDTTNMNIDEVVLSIVNYCGAN